MQKQSKKSEHFSHLNNLVVQFGNTKTFQLKCHYKNLAEEKIFPGVLLSFDQTNETTKKLKVEISMQYEQMKWKVKVVAYNRERKDNTRKHQAQTLTFINIKPNQINRNCSFVRILS